MLLAAPDAAEPALIAEASVAAVLVVDAVVDDVSPQPAAHPHKLAITIPIVIVLCMVISPFILTKFTYLLSVVRR